MVPTAHLGQQPQSHRLFMTQHYHQAHFCQETIQHNVVVTCLLCFLRSHFELDRFPALPSSQQSAGPWAKSTLASLWARAGPDHLHPPWVEPPKLSWPSHCCKPTGEEEGGDPCLESQSWRKTHLEYSHCLCNCSLHQVLFWQLKMRDTLPHEEIWAAPTDSETTSFTLCICQS